MTQKAKTNVLFVCTGNTCRSPMAEGYFNAEAKKRGLRAEALSAGISVINEYPATLNAIQELKKDGIDISNHISRRVTPELLETAHAIYAMTSGHAEVLKMMAPQLAEKIRPIAENDISDPYGGGNEEYSRAAKEIKAAVDKILEKLEGQYGV